MISASNLHGKKCLPEDTNNKKTNVIFKTLIVNK